MKNLLLVLFCICLLSFSSVRVRANEPEADIDAEIAADTGSDEPKTPDVAPETEEPEYDEEEEEAQLSASPDMETSFVFPDFPDKKLALGERVKMLVGFANKGGSVFKVTHMGASLHSRYDYSYFIQNFTAARYWNVELGAGQEAAVEYQFQPDESLEPLEFWFSAFVLYNNSNGDQFVNTVYNGTVELVEKPKPVDFRQFFTYLVALGGAGLVVYIFVSSKKPTASKKVQETGTRSAEEVEIYRPAATQKAVKRSRSRKSTSKSPAKAKASN